MKDEPDVKEMKYASSSESGGSMKKTLLWVVLIVVVIAVLVVFFINRRTGSKDAEYMAIIDRANTALALEEFKEARKHYAAARMIKPEEPLPSEKIALIDSVLAAITDIDSAEPAPKEDTAIVKTKEEQPESPGITAGEEVSREEITPPPSKSITTPSEPESQPMGLYHIIVGSFSVKSNAVNLSRKLREKGIDSRVIPIQEGRMSAVTYGSYETEEQAFRALRQVQREYSKNAWVFKK